MSLESEFWSRVKVGSPDECWPWLGTVNRNGYGVMFVKRWLGQSTMRAHKVSMLLRTGATPVLDVDHTCHNSDDSCLGGKECAHRRCVNPSHLEEVTRRENLLRGNTHPAREARNTHCPHGHKYPPYVPGRSRKCAVCNRNRVAKHRAQHGRLPLRERKAKDV